MLVLDMDNELKHRKQDVAAIDKEILAIFEDTKTKRGRCYV